MKQRSVFLLLGMVAVGSAVPVLCGTFGPHSRQQGCRQRLPKMELPSGKPKLAVACTRHEFSVMEVGQTAEHTFTIRNEGSAELALYDSRPTCSCLQSSLLDPSIPPGGMGRIVLRWKPPKPAELFAQGVRLHTNDPEQPSVYFSVAGSVRQRLAVWPESVVFSSVPVGESATRRLIVYSQVWDVFQLDVNSSHLHISLKTEPARDEDLAPVQARSGYAVELTLLPQALPGRFAANVVFAATPAGNDGEAAEELRKATIAVGGVITPRIWLQGANLVDSRRLLLGHVPMGNGKQAKLALFVRGDRADVQITDVAVRPEFLGVHIGQRQQVSEKLARYPIEIEIPPDAPAVACLGSKSGHIRLATNHPDASELRLDVELAVISEP